MLSELATKVGVLSELATKVGVLSELATKVGVLSELATKVGVISELATHTRFRCELREHADYERLALLRTVVCVSSGPSRQALNRIVLAAIRPQPSGRKTGKRITSRIDFVPVSNMTSRSIPIPSPPAGGMA